MTGVLRELRLAARNLVRRPGFTGIGVGTLALGLGAAAAIFAVVEGVLLEPLPFAEPDRLVSVYHPMEGEGFEGEWPLTRHTYLLFRDENRAFSAMGAYQPEAVSVVGPEVATEEAGALATPGLWPLLGARPAAGRLLDEADGRPGAPPVAVLSHELWQRRFGGDPSVVGRTLKIGGETVEVVGVVEPGFRLPSRQIGGQQEGNVALWLPYEMDPTAPVTDQFRLRTLARLRSGIGIEEAQSDVERLTRRLTEELPQVFSPEMLERAGFGTSVRPLRDTVLGSLDRTLWIVFAAVGVVLLIACANVANLFVVRTEGRSREVSVRAALGAGRRDLTAHFLAESFLLSAAAGIVGLGLATVGVDVLVSMAPPTLPRLDRVGLGWETVAFTGGLVALATLFLGAYPVLRFGVRPSTSELGGRSAAGGGSSGAGGARSGLVVIQVAMALVLMVASGVLLESFQRLREVEPGFSPEGVLALEVTLPEDRYGSPEETLVGWRQILERVGGIPGVSDAATGPVPLEMGAGCSAMFVEGRPVNRQSVECVRIPTLASAGYLELLDVRVVEGRTLRPDDADSRSGAAVVTADLARRLWPGESALGKGIKPRRPGEPFYRIVGVVEPIRGESLSRPTTEMVFLPLVAMEDEPGWNPTSMNLLVEAASGAPGALSSTVRRALAETESEAAVGRVRSLDQVVGRSMVGVTFPMLLLGVAAAAALLLGTVGLYGVMAHRVGARRSEMGVRMALGASHGQVRGMVFRQALGLTAVGLVLGAGASLAANRALRSTLFGVAPDDPGVLGGAAVLLTLTCAVAAWVPALRATRVDPAETLRAE